MQHSPQEIKSRLDKAVDPEGNVVDMVAVLELVTTLERLPLTREALETTRIGKTINLLRKKTVNSDLAKRAKKLVKKWQKLVINQLEASRSIDSPINGSRISSPQINGAIKDGKPASTDKLKTKVNDGNKKGVKRKRSTSSLSNSPLTLSQDTSPFTPSDNSSNPSSPFTTIATTELLNKESLPSENKRLKVSGDAKEKIGRVLVDETETKVDDFDGKISSSQDVHNDINTAQDCSINRGQRHDSLDSFHNDSGIDSLGSHVNTPSSQQLTPSQESDAPSSSTIINNVQKELNNDTTKLKQAIEYSDHSVTKNDSHGDKVEGSLSNSVTQKLESVTSNTSEEMQSSTNTNNNISTNLENLHDTLETKEKACEISNESKMGEDDEMEDENMEIKSTEPKELVLDLDQEANGINGRFNDQGTWYSWTDVMPCNDGNLHILPYVILD